MDLSYDQYQMYIPHSYINEIFMHANNKLNSLQTQYFNFYRTRAKREITYKQKIYFTTTAMINYYHWLLDKIKDWPHVYFSRHCFVEHPLIKKINLDEENNSQKTKKDIFHYKIINKNFIREKIKQMIHDDRFLNLMIENIILTKYIGEWPQLPDARKREIFIQIKNNILNKFNCI